ncbi:MAG: hypothetical protein OZ921_15840, partial [Sorangiineae bacterium]|nr:hypothetical protein [Sorangiineae bacterium]
MARRARLAVLAVLVAGCGPAEVGEGPLGERSERVSAPSDAYCSITVTGTGTIDLEGDYLPHVIQCENGGAGLEALKAQAIAARSVAYYAIATGGSICDGQGCQVYSCGATPNATQRAAVDATRGMYLSYAGMLTYGFYVAGDGATSPPACRGAGGATEKYVTYNQGKSGTGVTQTSLGYIGPPGYGQNRGCMGQWGARCLENGKGYDYRQILQFYYGDDIGTPIAKGPCTETTPALDAKFSSQGSDAPADPEGKAYYEVCAGAPVTFWFTLENTGTATWTDSGGSATGSAVRLGVPGDAPDPFLGVNRMSLAENTNPEVAPGGGDCDDQPTCRKTVFTTGPSRPARAPLAPGLYETRWRLLDEGRTWFGPEMYLTFDVVDCGSAGAAGAAGR